MAENTITQLKADASRAFATKDYVRANKLWDDALKMGPSDADVALIHNNKAACHMVKKRWSQAVQECTLALDRQPDYVKALMRRGKAYESMREYGKAEDDYGKAALLGNAEAKQGEARVKRAQVTSAGAARAAAGAAPGGKQGDMAKSMKSFLDQFAKMGGKGMGSGASGQQAQDGSGNGAQAEAWLMQLVHLLRKYYGLDIEKPIIEGEIAMDKVNAAMLEMMKTDAEDAGRVEELLEEAGLKYKEQVAFGMAGEATVKDILVDRITQKVARDGSDVRNVMSTIEPLLEASDKLIGDAIAYCPPRTAAMVDLMINRSQLYLRRASLAANYVVEAVPMPDADGSEGVGKDEAAAQADARQKSALEAAYARISKDGKALENAGSWLDMAVKTLEEALEHVPGDDVELLDVTPAQLKNNVLITIGNTYYEASLLKAGGGLEWRGDIERAKASFEEAQASPVDIRNALLGHVKASELEDLIGEEIADVEKRNEAEAGSAGNSGAAAAAAASEKGPKGLPSLKKKKGNSSK